MASVLLPDDKHVVVIGKLPFGGQGTFYVVAWGYRLIPSDLSSRLNAGKNIGDWIVYALPIETLREESRSLRWIVHGLREE